MTTNIFLDQAGLTHYDSKLKTVVAGSFSIAGKTITLKSISGATLGTIEVPDTVYDLASATKNGLMSSIQFTKLEGISEGATKTTASGTNGKLSINGQEINVYVHPTHSALTSGLYKVTVDGSGHVTAGTKVVKSDITALGIPGQDTTYEPATASTDGLMTSAQFGKLNGIAANAQVNVLEKVSVNGSALPISSKGVNIDLSPYAKKSDITSVVKLKGSVETYADLPPNPEDGHMYNVKQADPAHGIKAGDNVVWNATEKFWDNFGGFIEIGAIPTSEIDKLFA